MADAEATNGCGSHPALVALARLLARQAAQDAVLDGASPSPIQKDIPDA